MFLNSAKRLEKESEVKVSAGDKKKGERAEAETTEAIAEQLVVVSMRRRWHKSTLRLK